jgi:hypothetical protein
LSRKKKKEYLTNKKNGLIKRQSSHSFFFSYTNNVDVERNDLLRYPFSDPPPLRGSDELFPAKL